MRIAGSPPTETSVDLAQLHREPEQVAAHVPSTTSNRSAPQKGDNVISMLRKFSLCYPTGNSVSESSPVESLANLQATTSNSSVSSRLRALESAVLSPALFYASNGTVPKTLMVTENNKIESVDICGDQIFASQAKLASSAKEEVLIQTFAWEPGSLGAKAILDGLLHAIDSRQSPCGTVPSSQKKMRICILINEGTGFAEKFMKMTSANRKGGTAKRWASTPNAIVGNYKSSADHKYSKLVENADFQVRVHQHSSSNSLHAKSIVVDGAKSALTGANVQSRNHGDGAAYDFGVTLSGPVSNSLREDFVTNWNASVNPDQETSKLEALSTSENFASSSTNTGFKMALVTRRPNWNVLNTRNDTPQNQAFLAALNNAQESIQIMTPNLNTPSVISALAKALKRGISVQIVISKGFNDDRVGNVIAGGTNDDALANLRKRSGNPENLDVRYFRNPRSAPDAPTPEGNVGGMGANHAKYLCVDGLMNIIGSANMDKTSWHFSGETNIAVFGQDAASALDRSVFSPAWAISEKALVSELG